MHRMTRSIVSLFIFISINAQTASEAIHLMEDEIGFGARSLALGGAYTALGNDASGMYWNPAGLAGISNGAIYFENNSLFYNNETTYGQERKNNPLRKSIGVNGLGIIYPVPTVRGSFVIGIGYNRIISYDGLMSFSGFSLRDNDLGFPITVDGVEKNYFFSKNVQRSEKVISSGGLEQLTFSFGIAISPVSSFGISISRLNGREDYEFSFSQQDLQNTYKEFPTDFNQYDLVQSLITKTKGWNVRTGLKTAINQWFQFGMAFSLPYTLNVKENHGTSEVLLFDNGDVSDVTETGRYDYEVIMPMVMDLGIAVTVDNLALSTSIRYKNWGGTQFNLQNIEKDSGEYLLFKEENKNIKYLYRSVIQFRAGAEYLWEFSDTFGMTFRAGGGLLPSPEGNSKTDQSFISLGLGIPIPQSMMLDMAFIIRNYEKKSSDLFTPSGTLEKVSTGRLLLNISYLF
jgi:hypothetical protein|tara:strand:+ start:14742 stop:16115 length:1374 start_codon:yes stop_codon:yes gene_type:complete